jgi:hypothetical protein
MREIWVIGKKKYLPQKGKTGAGRNDKSPTVKYRTENWGDEEHEINYKPLEST